jgi:formylglycine-generating enzyme required for sulfatase activity
MLRISIVALCLLVTAAFTGAKALPAGMKMVDIPGGTFDMESTGETITVGDFKMSETEVTWGQYCEFLNAKQPGPLLRKKWIKLSDEEESSHISRSGKTYKVDEGWVNHPVVNVSMAGAKAFCVYYGLRLPKEAEWEYAAGGPNHTKYPWGDEFDATKFCFKGNRGSGNPKTMPIKSFSENGYGLYDMAGNTAEWCSGPDAMLWGGSWSVIGSKIISDVHGGRSNAGFGYTTDSTQTAAGDNDTFWCPAGDGGFRPAGD